MNHTYTAEDWQQSFVSSTIRKDLYGSWVTPNLFTKHEITKSSSGRAALFLNLSFTTFMLPILTHQPQVAITSRPQLQSKEDVTQHVKREKLKGFTEEHGTVMILEPPKRLEIKGHGN
ncbi:hypothetical protein BC938DRAFT_475927 [Jimgerdemannia flammicorona]|uniref:Uncharacterized protein n=1 Tax=Jimgerdemannia flammicorona TaxID=994334 RepID=A0A433PM79_9FUNG|nr:hypothetical protein BC938DRAFT_475927 [Jimgerdemannia flammicorona]